MVRTRAGFKWCTATAPALPSGSRSHSITSAVSSSMIDDEWNPSTASTKLNLPPDCTQATRWLLPCRAATALPSAAPTSSSPSALAARRRLCPSSSTAAATSAGSNASHVPTYATPRRSPSSTPPIPLTTRCCPVTQATVPALPPCVTDSAIVDTPSATATDPKRPVSSLKDTLTLTSSYVLDDFVFGCGEANSGLFGEVAGIIGLGRDHISLPSQANGGAFSYCLPPYASSTGYLALGTSNGSRPNSPKNLHFTSMPSRSDAPSFYFVELVGISVGGKDLRISPTSFSDPGTFIDSGTVLTYLPADAYAALRSEFRWRMSKYPTSAGVDPLDTCYDMEGYDRVAVPAVVLHFSGGARLDVDSSGILFTLDRSSAIACLAFAEKDPNGFTIIGNMQQKTYNIVYDVPNEKIGFGAGGCTADPF